MSSSINCKHCGNQVPVPGKKVPIKCDSCNIKHWGYLSLIDLPVPDNMKLYMLQHQNSFSPEEDVWIKQNKNIALENEPPVKRKAKSAPAISSDKNQTKAPPLNDIIGWLFVKMEGKKQITYPIKKGLNTIGRTTSVFKTDISLDSDKYVSRYHLKLLAEEISNNRFRYYIVDGSDHASKRPSLNGTYTNGNKKRITPEKAIEIFDKDTIQIGLTKLVFKAAENEKKEDEAHTEVLNQDYTQTIPSHKFEKF